MDAKTHGTNETKCELLLTRPLFSANKTPGKKVANIK